MSYRILIEIGHEAAIRTKRTPEGYTHDWEIFVRGFESDIQHYVEKVVFNLHETFDRPRRAIKEPPYKVKESGYAGFNLLIDLYLKNPEEPKKISFFYDLSLQPSGPAIYKVQKEKYVFHHPNEEFRQRLIKGGAALTPSSSSISSHINESSRDAGGLSDRSEERAQLVDKPKLGGDISRKHKVRPEEPKLTTSFTDLFGPPITKKSKISPEPKVPQVKSAPVTPVVVDRSKEKSSSDKVKKHSPHKDKAERSKSKDKDHSKKSKDERSKDKGKEREKGKDKSSKKDKSPHPKHESPKRSPKHESPKKSPRRVSPAPVQAPPPPPPPPKKEERHKYDDTKEKEKSSDKKSKKDKRDKGKEKDKHREHKSHSSKEEKSTEEAKESKIKEQPKIKDVGKEKDNPVKSKEKVPKVVEPPPPVREKEYSVPDKVEKPDKAHKSDKHDEKHKHKHKKKDKEKSKKEDKKHEKKVDKNQIEITKVPLDESSSSSKTSVQADVEKENQSKNSNEVLIEKTAATKDKVIPIPPQPKLAEVQPMDEESNDSNISERRKSKNIEHRSHHREPKTIPEPVKELPPEPIEKPVTEKPKKSKKHKDKHKSTDKDEKKRKRKSSSKILETSQPETESTEDVVIEKVAKLAPPVKKDEVQPIVDSEEEGPPVAATNGAKKEEVVDDTEEDEVEFVGPAGIMPMPFLSDDYLVRLKDLQERIMMLQDNGELQKVVQLIAETGHYEVTRHSFNFDLCTLDNATVARLQQFFTTHPGTA